MVTETCCLKASFYCVSVECPQSIMTFVLCLFFLKVNNCDSCKHLQKRCNTESPCDVKNKKTKETYTLAICHLKRKTFREIMSLAENMLLKRLKIIIWERTSGGGNSSAFIMEHALVSFLSAGFLLVDSDLKTPKHGQLVSCTVKMNP